jgi:hypothetical protein
MPHHLAFIQQVCANKLSSRAKFSVLNSVIQSNLISAIGSIDFGLI